MSRTPRHLACSSRFRALAWLAWLILAVTPAYGSAGGMAMSDAHHAGLMASAAHVVGHGRHAMPVDADCCGEQGHGQHGTTDACHCAAVCGSVLPAVAMVELAAAPLAIVQRPAPIAAPPSVPHAPPLRPPTG
ncbi:hypothetical protein [Rhodanobacter terrae]|uniref:CopL family metal-binding regulatory protein n=1 Tax=Rhodanobacter terrae TaxID=418647 RepID=A0ABW0SZK2_9GAMM